MKIVALDTAYWPEGGFGHWCPACKSGHEINVDKPNSSGAKWSFNGDFARPTFTPSVNMQINPPGHPHYQPDVKSVVCHYFITDGKIIYCGDCTHELRGQTVDLPDLPDQAYVTSQFAAREGAQNG